MKYSRILAGEGKRKSLCGRYTLDLDLNRTFPKRLTHPPWQSRNRSSIRDYSSVISSYGRSSAMNLADKIRAKVSNL